MRILLLGEYSRLHLSLAEALTSLGHQVTLASDGDGYKQYSRDVDLSRKNSKLLQTFKDIYSITKKIKSFKNYDVVQIINPCFTTLNVRINKYYFDLLKNQNKKIFLGAFGVDSLWLKAAMNKEMFRYSEFHINKADIDLGYNKRLIQQWINSPREKLNYYTASHVNGIISCLYEYQHAYQTEYGNKLKYIPLPIQVNNIPYSPIVNTPDKINFFIGIDKDRSQFKGTDILLDALHQVQKKYPTKVNVTIAESIPYAEYQNLMNRSHVVLDQIYSYSPSMNPLQAMALGKIAVTGGEPEIYELLDKNSSLRPIVNVLPTIEGAIEALEYIVEHKHRLAEWSQQSREFVEKYHDAHKVAQLYLDFWESR